MVKRRRTPDVEPTIDNANSRSRDSSDEHDPLNALTEKDHAPGVQQDHSEGTEVAADESHDRDADDDGELGAATDDVVSEQEEREDSAPSDKRKRKRTRTRKKKGAASASTGGDPGDGGLEGGDEVGGQDGLPAGVTDTVYVEGIPWTCDESDVREFFKGCGKINAVRMPRWQDSGRPRGYAHVAFAGASGARAAFGRTGQYLKGRYLTVQAPQEPATEKARRANRTAEQPRGCRTVFLKNLPYDVNEDGVHEALSGCGRIASVRLAMWNHTRKMKGFGYVEFLTERGAGTCVRKQESLSIGGRPVVVDFETGAPKGSFRRQDGAQIKKTSADAGVGKGKAPKFKVHA